MLTRSGWLVAAAGIVSLVVGRLFALPELFVLGTTLVVLVGIGLAWVARPLPSLRVERIVHPPRVPLGGRSRVELRIANRGRRRTPVVQLVDPVEGTVGARLTLAPLRPGQTHDAGYRLPTDRRGLRRLGPLRAEVADPFGLARRTVEVTGPATLTVFPAVEAIAGVPLGGGRDEPLAGLVRRASSPATHDDFAALRPYVVGDDLRRVHWPSTARAGDLLVRQDDLRWQGHVTVVLDSRADRIDAGSFEAAVSAAASVVAAVASTGDRVRLLLGDGTDSGLLTAHSAGDMVLEHLAVVARHEGGTLPPIPQDGRRHSGTLVVVTGVPTTDDLFAIAAARGSYGITLLVTVGAGEPPTVPPGVDVVQVDPSRRFAPQWAAAMAKRTPGRRSAPRGLR